MFELILAILLGLASPSSTTTTTNNDGTTVVIPENLGKDTGGETGNNPIR